MLAGYDRHTKLILMANIALLICLVFYVGWWIIAFNPIYQIRGFSSAWLLIFAITFGVVFTVLGIAGSWLFHEKRALYSNIGVAICGAALYFIVLFITWLGFDRMITEELFLITGWLVMVLIEINALYVHERLKKQTAVALVIICLALTIVSYVCYVLYYDLGTVGRFIDGILPLLLCGFGMIGTITVLAAFPRPVMPQKPYRIKDCIPKSD